jgi:hypothetical protein
VPPLRPDKKKRQASWGFESRIRREGWGGIAHSPPKAKDRQKSQPLRFALCVSGLAVGTTVRVGHEQPGAAVRTGHVDPLFVLDCRDG